MLGRSPAPNGGASSFLEPRNGLLSLADKSRLPPGTTHPIGRFDYRSPGPGTLGLLSFGDLHMERTDLNTRTDWSAWDVFDLRNSLEQRRTNAEIAILLMRTEAEVREKVAELGLTFPTAMADAPQPHQMRPA